MNKLSRVFGWNFDSAETYQYDGILACLGYERRSRYVFGTGNFAGIEKHSFGFLNHNELSYRDNLRWFSRNGYNVNAVSDDDFRLRLRGLFSSIRGSGAGPVRWCVDISSISRLRMAMVFAEVSRCDYPMDVDFVYAVAKFTPPIKEMPQIESAGPVLDEFAGWSSRPEMPVAAMFGLGYEYDKAVGALDFLEPAQVWAFQALSSDKRYDTESRRANAFLWGDLPNEKRLMYSVTDPFNTFMDLESLVFGLEHDARPVLIPFGPKIFSLCCLLVALVHAPKVAVWRVSSGSHEAPVDRFPDGTIVGLRASFLPNPELLIPKENGARVNPLSL